jgi:uncharacterized membrane protein YgcG
MAFQIRYFGMAIERYTQASNFYSPRRSGTIIRNLTHRHGVIMSIVVVVVVVIMIMSIILMMHRHAHTRKLTILHAHVRIVLFLGEDSLGGFVDGGGALAGGGGGGSGGDEGEEGDGKGLHG